MIRPAVPDLSVVVVSYNVCNLLAGCLQALRENNAGLTLATTVVDNASGDGSAAMVEERFHEVWLVRNQENVGFAAANNQALRLAQGRHVLLLNPDTEVKPGALQTLVSWLDDHPKAGACGGRLEYPDGTLQHSAFRFPTLLQVFFDLFPPNWRLRESRLNGRYPRARYRAQAPFPVDHPLGACLMVRRQALEEVGLLDEGFFIYAEEVDLCIRLKKAGWEVWCLPGAEIVHYQARSTRQFRARMFVELWRARLRLFDKHYPPAFRMAVRGLVKLAAARHLRSVSATPNRSPELVKEIEAYREVLRLVSSARPPPVGMPPLQAHAAPGSQNVSSDSPSSHP